MRTSVAILMTTGLIFTVAAQAKLQSVELDRSASKVKWTGKKVTGQHHGFVKIGKGKIAIDEKTLMPQSGQIVIDLRTIENQDIESKKYRTKLENHLKSPDFFDVGKHPEAKVQITGTKREKGRTLVKASLTIKGITHPIEFPAEIKKEGKRFRAKAKLKFDRSKWQIKHNSGKFFDVAKLGDKLIYDDIEIELDLVTR